MLDKYQVAWACVQGKAHRKTNPPTPCQDSCIHGSLTEQIQVAIVSDGAGSSQNSHLASSFCVKRLYEVCDSRTAMIQQLTEQIKANPGNEEAHRTSWTALSRELFVQTRTDLLEYGKNNGYEPSGLNCTLILLVNTPAGIFSAHVGDGRAGCYNGKEVRPLIVPFMTFTAGATFFLIKEGWENVFRANMILDEHIQYFFASTDGCQDFVIDHSAKGPRTGTYDVVLGGEAFYDLNLPYHPFFEGTIKSLREAQDSNERNRRLQQLIDEGIYRFDGKETVLSSIASPVLDDDKTLILYFS